MSDYRNTWEARRAYYSPEAVVEREDAQAEADMARREREQLEMQNSQALGEQGFIRGAEGYDIKVRIPGPETGSLTDPGVIGSGLRRPVEQPKGRASKTAEAVGTIASNVGERALDAVPSIGVGLINMADNVLDFGAHSVGLEDHYNRLSKWFENHADLYEPTTSTGPIVAAISQVAAPYAGTAKALHMAGVSKVLSGIIAAGTAEGLAIAPADDNFAEIVKGWIDTAPEAPELVRWSLLDAFSKSEGELRILAEAERRVAAEASLSDSADQGDAQPGQLGDFDAEAYREAYFSARLKNALAGVASEALGEALIIGAKGLYKTMRAMKDPAARRALARTARRVAGELSPTTGPMAGQRGSMQPFLEHRRENTGTLQGMMAPEVGARAIVASTVESGEALLEEASTLKGRNITHQQLAGVFPPDTRRADGLPEAPQRHTTRAGGRFADLDLDVPAAPNVRLADQDIQALWHEAIEFMERQGYPAQQVINDIRTGSRGKKAVRPKGADFWERSLQLPNRARYWYEVSAEGMRDMLPDLTDEEFMTFIDLVAMTSQSTAPTQNMMRAIGVLSHTLRDLPSEQDIIDPTSLLRTFGQANEGLKVGSFGGTFLHHLGLREMPQLSTNDRQVASTFGMGAIDVAQNPVMYGVLSRFYQNLRDHLNLKQGAKAEPWETWQLQAMGWVQERIEGGNTDFEDYLAVLQRLSVKAQAAGLPVGPNGELTKAVLSDPRLDPIMATTIEEYRRKMKVGLPIVGKTNGYQDSIGMRREFEILGDEKAVSDWHDMERRAIKGLMQNRSAPRLDADGNQVFTKKNTKAMDTNPSPAQQLASALAGKKQTVSRTIVGANEAGAVGRIPLPANASEEELGAWLSVMGSELGQANVRAGRFRYLETPPEEMSGKATSVLYQHPEPLTPDQVQAFQQRLGEGWQVDAHTAPNGTVLDVHPREGAPADPAALEAAVRDSGLNESSALVVFSEYTGVAIDKGGYSKSMAAWRNGVIRSEAEPFAKALGGMGEARAVIQGRASIPDDMPGGKALRTRLEKARDRVANRFTAVEEARRTVREVRKQLDADAAAYIEENAGRLERRRQSAERRNNEQ